MSNWLARCGVKPTPQQILKFLQSLGWTEDLREAGVKVIMVSPDGERAIMVPINTEYVDFDRRYAEAILAIATDLQCSATEACAKIMEGDAPMSHTHKTTCNCGGQCSVCQGCGHPAQPDGSRCCNKCRVEQQLMLASAECSLGIQVAPEGAPAGYVLFAFHLTEELVEDDVEGTVIFTIYTAMPMVDEARREEISFGGLNGRYHKAPGAGDTHVIDLHEIRQFIASEILNDTISPYAVKGVYLDDQFGVRVPLLWYAVAPADAMAVRSRDAAPLFVTIGRGPNDPDREEFEVAFPAVHVPIDLACDEASGKFLRSLKDFILHDRRNKADLTAGLSMLGTGLVVDRGEATIIKGTIVKREG